MAKSIKNISAKDIKSYFEKQAKRIRKKIDTLDFADPLALHTLRKVRVKLNYQLLNHLIT
jgi:hypothetical protein